LKSFSYEKYSKKLELCIYGHKNIYKNPLHFDLGHESFCMAKGEIALALGIIFHDQWFWSHGYEKYSQKFGLSNP